ncbi:mCG118282, partial [Mus musculus]
NILQKLKQMRDQVKILLRHNCSPGALGVQSKLTTIASDPCNHGNLGLHFLLFWFAMGNEAFILSSLWSSKTACLEGFREVLRYIKICSASRRALRMPILAGPFGSSRIISW